jgi:peptidyl-prolyl cis-trans isomerase C
VTSGIPRHESYDISAVVRQLKVSPGSQNSDPASSPSKSGRARRYLAQTAHEPFVQFLLLGLLIWGGLEYLSAERDRYVIQIGATERQRIADTYARQFGQPPTGEQLAGLIERYVREEIYWREGLALRLDQDDEIVRRRIVQKYEFLQTDLGVTDPPGDGVLQQWFEQHLASYLNPQRIAFTHVYFSMDRDGEQAARARAIGVLKEVRARGAARAADQGDPFPGPTDVSALAPEEAGRLFGQSPLTEALFELPVGQWSGPLRSGYGWHLVYIMSRSPPRLPLLADIRERVLTDYQDEQRRLSDARRFEALKARYTIRADEVRP